MGPGQVRLILKISNKLAKNFSTPMFHLGRPYVTSNFAGDLIWAASVEPVPELYEWLLGLGEDCQILDPPDLSHWLLQHHKKTA